MRPAKAREPAKILVVDDTPANLLLLVRMLSERGYQPKPVHSGALALEVARAERPDLILLDITMPQMNGYEVCAKLKADPALSQIPVIFISALNETVEKVKAFNVGGVDYVTKPFQFEEVYARIHTHLELHRLQRLRDDLAHMIVHDLRSPLAVISTFLDVLEDYEAQKLSAESQKLVVFARRSARDMVNMIGSLLDVSRMTAGEMKLEREDCELVALVRTLMDSHQLMPGDRSLTLDAPEASTRIAADVGLIRRVLQNLVGNALKHTPAGGKVHIVVTRSDHQIRVAVSDAGPGIAFEHQQRIFERFSQIEDGKSHLGTGMGLTFCKLAVEAHGGRIGVDSEIGKGSTFWMSLPQGGRTLAN